MKFSILATLAVTPVLLLTGCGAQGGSTDAVAPASSPGAAEAAASGVAEVIRSEAAGRPIPRDGVPDYVETMPDASYMTSSSGENALRSTGMMMYGVKQPAAEVIAFHRASMERLGMTPGEATSRPVRKTTETRFEGQSSDGRSKLAVTVIESGKATIVVQLHYSDEKG
jgi:hypothetical protein